VGGHAGGGPTQYVAGNYQVSIGTADASRTFGGYPAWSHVAVLTAGAVQAEAAMGFLGIKPVKGSLDAYLLQMLKHLAYRRIRSTGNDISFGRKF
jgi:hypothetical protein